MSLSGLLRRARRRLVGDPVHDETAPYRGFVEAVNGLGPELRDLSDRRLEARAAELVHRIRSGETGEPVLVPFFALVREVSRRVLGLTPFDVQIAGGLALHRGRIVEMRTGEGKTLTAVAPAAFNALSGKGLHVLTFNDYLAGRDAGWMGPVYRFLGLSVGHVHEGTAPAERRAAYRRDITYLTAKQAGFDYLRDCLAYDPADQVHRPFHMALVDEADSLMIDEARIPLVIAAASGDRQDRTADLLEGVRRLNRGADYVVDEDKRTVHLTDSGLDRIESWLNLGELHALESLPVLSQVNVFLHAHALMRRDVDYIVREGRIESVDEFTGRVVKDRQWPDGLQAAIETMEGLRQSDAGRVLGSMTLQHFLKRYPRLCGMTATAVTAAEELRSFYDVEIQVVPPDKPCIREDLPHRVFRTRSEKQDALRAEISEVHGSGRPILVGTTSVEESEQLAAELSGRGIACQVLNARNDAAEAAVVAEAGAPGAVTISTNMAGRGTDIRLGGRDEGKREQVVGLGGLYVIGTNLHESRRVDDQLRGRAGRQGDPGRSCFFVSLEDDLPRRVGIEKSPVVRLLSRSGGPMESPALVKELDHAQRVVEGKAFDIRQSLYQFSRYIERQRQVLMLRRDPLLAGTAGEGPLSRLSPERFEKARGLFGDEAVRELERRLMLRAIDAAWEDHLARTTSLRESIHLTELGGMQPLDQFQRQAARLFDALEESLDSSTAELFDAIDLEAAGPGLENAAPGTPSATWTYLVNDSTFRDSLAASLVSHRNIGFSAAAALHAPLLLLWALIVQWRKRRRKSPGGS